MTSGGQNWKTEKRRKPTRDERQAAAYLMLTRGDGTPIVTRDEAKGMTAREIIERFEALVDWHHAIEHAIGGSMHPTNVGPMARDEHKQVPSAARVAKAKRIAKATEEFRRRLLAKDAGEQAKAPARTRRGNRPMPFARGSKLKRTVGGKVVER